MKLLSYYCYTVNSKFELENTCSPTTRRETEEAVRHKRLRQYSKLFFCLLKNLTSQIFIILEVTITEVLGFLSEKNNSYYA